MKSDFSAQLQELYIVAKRYLSFQIDVAKYSLAERVALLLGGLALGLIGLLSGGILVLFLAFSAASLFRTIMSPALCPSDCGRVYRRIVPAAISIAQAVDP